MKSFLRPFMAIFLISTGVSAKAETLHSCKKRNSMIYSSFYWAEILKNDAGELLFQYGNGVDSQMTEILFESKVEETKKGVYHFQNDQYTLEATLKDEKLSFSVLTGNKRYSKNKFICYF